MPISLRSPFIAACALLSLLAPVAQAAPQYTSVVVPGQNTGWSAINNSGHVGGWAFLSDSSRARVYDGVQTWTSGTLGGSTVILNGLNDLDQVVGTSALAGNRAARAVVATVGGTLTDLGTLGGQSSRGNAINNAGTVVGNAELASGNVHAFSYQASTGMVDLGTLGGTRSDAWDVNAHGDIVGESTTANGAFHAFIYSNGVMTDLNPILGSTGSLIDLKFGANGTIFGNTTEMSFIYDFNHLSTFSNTEILAINAHGDILTRQDVTIQGVKYSLASLLADSGVVTNQWVNGLDFNDQGQILVSAMNQTFILSAVPEPATWAMLFAGLGLIVLVRRRA